jgi:hypothetical protein
MDIPGLTTFLGQLYSWVNYIPGPTTTLVLIPLIQATSISVALLYLLFGSLVILLRRMLLRRVEECGMAR